MSNQYLSSADIAIIRQHGDFAHGSVLSSGGLLSDDEKKYFCMRCMNLSSAFAQKNPMQHIGCIYYHLRNASHAPRSIPAGAAVMASDMKFEQDKQDPIKRGFMQSLRDLGCVFPANWGELGYPTRTTPSGSPVAGCAAATAAPIPTAAAAEADDAEVIDASEMTRRINEGLIDVQPDADLDDEEIEDELANDDDDDDDYYDDEDQNSDDDAGTETEPDDDEDADD